MRFAPGQVHLPTADAEADLAQYDEEEGSAGGFGATAGKVQVTQQINHAGEVNRARVCPQNKFLIATKTVLPLACLAISLLPRPSALGLQPCSSPELPCLVSSAPFPPTVIGGQRNVGAGVPVHVMPASAHYESAADGTRKCCSSHQSAPSKSGAESLADFGQCGHGWFSYPKLMPLKAASPMQHCRYESSGLLVRAQVSAEVYVFDYTKHPSKPAADNTCSPDIKLRGHNTEARC